MEWLDRKRTIGALKLLQGLGDIEILQIRDTRESNQVPDVVTR